MDHAGCPTPEVLRAFALGDLEEAELDSVASHLDSCRECSEAMARWDSQADAVLREVRRRLGGGSQAVGSTEAAAASGRPAAPPAAPERLDDFRVVREIGRGGMGVVYEAYQESLNRHVALKLLREPADLARFRREARAAGRLHHTNIVPVYGVGEHAGRHYYVMQYIAGRGLDDVLREHRGGRSPARAAVPRGRLPRGGADRRCRPPRPSPTRTTRASSTATSSRRTSCSTSGAPSGSPTSAWRTTRPTPRR